MTIRQLEHEETTNEVTKHSFVVVSENVRTPENIGMMFRVAEAFGVEAIYVCGNSPDLMNKKVRKTTRSTEKQVTPLFSQSIDLIIKELKSNNYHLIALELTTKSKAIRDFKLPDNKKIALFVGSERNGISDSTLLQMDDAIYIPMKGKNSSINVVNALAIGLYQLCD